MLREGKGEVIKSKTQCPHPPQRLYAWYAGDILCIACCQCGKVLKGGKENEESEPSNANNVAL